MLEDKDGWLLPLFGIIIILACGMLMALFKIDELMERVEKLEKQYEQPHSEESRDCEADL